MCDCGKNGRVSSGRLKVILNFMKNLFLVLFIFIWFKSNISKEQLPLVADEAFAMRENFFKIFSQTELERESRVFN